MDRDLKARCAARLASNDWESGVAASHDELQEREMWFWKAQAPEFRLQACFEASRDAWSVLDQDTLEGIDWEVHGRRSMEIA